MEPETQPPLDAAFVDRIADLESVKIAAGNYVVWPEDRRYYRRMVETIIEAALEELARPTIPTESP